MSENPAQKKKPAPPVMTQYLRDIRALFLDVFDNENGRKVIAYLDKYAHTNYPNFDNVYATYAKAGQQQLVDHILGVIIQAKKKE